MSKPTKRRTKRPRGLVGPNVQHPPSAKSWDVWKWLTSLDSVGRSTIRQGRDGRYDR